MIEIEILDKIFNYMKTKPNVPISISLINRLYELGINNDTEMRSIEAEIMETKLVDYEKGKAANWFSLQLNDYGVTQLNKYKSYSEYLKNIDAEQISKLETEQMAKKKLKVDLANAERIYKTYRSTRIIAWSGFIFGLIALILKLLEVFGKLPLK